MLFQLMLIEALRMTAGVKACIDHVVLGPLMHIQEVNNLSPAHSFLRFVVRCSYPSHRDQPNHPSCQCVMLEICFQ